MATETFVVDQVWRSERDGREYRWRVTQVFGDGRAVLQSCRAEWCTTRPLTMAEWQGEGVIWEVESPRQSVADPPRAPNPTDGSVFGPDMDGMLSGHPDYKRSR
jgi:hypothetical protein